MSKLFSVEIDITPQKMLLELKLYLIQDSP